MNYIGAPVVTKQTNPGDLAGPIGARGTHTLKGNENDSHFGGHTLNMYWYQVGDLFCF